MATTNLELTLKAFWRRQGEGDIVIGNTPSYPTLTPTPSRYNLDMCYDYYWFAGIILFRVLDKISLNFYPSIRPLITVVDKGTLTSNEYTLALSDVERIIDDVVVEYGATYYKAVLLNELQYNQYLLNERTSPIFESPYWIYDGIKLKILAPFTITYSKVSFRYIKPVSRIVLSESNLDIWQSNFTDILVEAMCMLAAGDRNEGSIEQFFSNKLLANYKTISNPSNLQNNEKIIQDIK